MTEKEIAEAIIVKYKNILPRMGYHVLEETAIECAKSEVTAIIDALKCLDKKPYASIMFWQGVLNEIK